MNRVETAIQQGRCVIAVGGRALQTPEVQTELRRRPGLPFLALGGAGAGAVAVSAEALAPALAEGGVLVLVEPEGASDGAALGELDRLVKASKPAPRLVVAARAFNPFAMPMGLRLLKTEQVKARAQDFLASLPQAPAPVVAAPVAAPTPKAEDRHRPPRPDLIARSEELAALGAMLQSDGGPIIVSGPSGVGKRWLIEAAVAASGLRRLPDLSLGRGVGADALLIRLAIALKQAGEERLHQALSATERPKPQALAELVAELLQGPALAGAVWVLHDLDLLLDRRDGSLYREGRLELILRELLTRPLALRLVIRTRQQPELHAEGLAQHLRRLDLKGLPGRELHELFDAWHAPAFPREHFGTINERTFGHPISARCIAIDARDQDIEDLIDPPRYLKAQFLGDDDALGRHLKRRIEELDEPTRAALHAAALLRDPGGPEELLKLGVHREQRAALLAAGLLEQTPTGSPRRYYVHALVQAQLDRRQVEDFGRMEALGKHFLELARELRKGGQDSESIALALEGNRLLIGARRGRDTIRLPYPDVDALIDDIRGLVRRKQPRFDIARQRVAEALALAPQVPELLLAKAEVLAGEKAKPDAVEAAFAEVAAQAPTPELFHRLATWHIDRAHRGKAADALRAGIQAFPANARLRRRLAGLLIGLQRLDEAHAILREALDLEPMMPDTYSLLAEVCILQGQEHWDRAATLVEEALALSPQDPQHLLRQALLLRARGCASPEQRDALWEQAEDKARQAWQSDKESLRAAAIYTRTMLDRVDALDATRLEQAEYILREMMKKKGELPDIWVQRARVLIHREAWKEAEELLDRALKAGGGVEAFMARGELWEARLQPFHAFEAWKAAFERSRPGTADRLLCEAQVQRFQVLIESGRAAEMMREKNVEPEPDPSSAGAGPRAARQVRRRKGRGGRGAEGAEAVATSEEGAEPAEEGPEEGPDEGPDGGEGTNGDPSSEEDELLSIPSELTEETVPVDDPGDREDPEPG